MSTRGKTTPDSTPGSYAPHAGQRSRIQLSADGSAQTSALQRPNALLVPDPQIVAAVDAAFARQTPLAVRPSYVIAVRRPLAATRYDTFDGEEGVEVLELEVGSYEDYDPSFEESRDWVQARLVEAATISDTAARQRFLDVVRRDIDNDESLLPLVAAVDYADAKPYRPVIAFQSVLSFNPQAIRDHFDGDGTDIAAWVAQASDAQLADVATSAIIDDRLYDTFHRILADAVNSTIAEQDQT